MKEADNLAPAVIRTEDAPGFLKRLHGKLTGPPPHMPAKIRFGMLGAMLLVTQSELFALIQAPPYYPVGRYESALVCTMILTYPLAWYFKWRPSVTVTLRMISLSSIFLIWLYIGYTVFTR